MSIYRIYYTYTTCVHTPFQYCNMNWNSIMPAMCRHNTKFPVHFCQCAIAISILILSPWWEKWKTKTKCAREKASAMHVAVFQFACNSIRNVMASRIVWANKQMRFIFILLNFNDMHICFLHHIAFAFRHTILDEFTNWTGHTTSRH